MTLNAWRLATSKFEWERCCNRRCDRASQLELLAQHSTKLVESEAVLIALFADSDKCVADLDAAINQHQGGLGAQLRARFAVVDALPLAQNVCMVAAEVERLERALNAGKGKDSAIASA